MPKSYSRSIKIIGIIVVVLVIVRIFLPYAVLRYAEYKINQIPDYHATIADIDLHLYKGSYVIKDLKLEKITNGTPVPFFSADRIELAVEWSALLKGSLVAQIYLTHPQLNFVVDPRSGKHEQTSISSAWQDAVKALFPLNFNKIIVAEGEIHYRSFTSQPPFNIYINQIDATVDNLRNVTRSQGLSSTLQLQGSTIGGASLNIEVHFDPFASQPTFDSTTKLERMDLSKSQNFLKHYTKLKVTQGIFSVYIEAAAKNGKIIGYVKPLIQNLKIADEKTNNPAKAVYKTAVKVVSKILENPQTKAIATKVKITGNIEDPNVNIWSLIVNILRNAFIQALLPKIDHSIEFKDVEIIT